MMVLDGWSGNYWRIYSKKQLTIGFSGKIYFGMKFKNFLNREAGLQAPLSDAERKKLNLEAGRLILSYRICTNVTDNKFDVLREKGFVGHANYFFKKCYFKSGLINTADIGIYRQLLEIDSRLGTTQTEQLFACVELSVRIDFIKV